MSRASKQGDKGHEHEVQEAMVIRDQNEDHANSGDQPGIPTAAPTPSPITKSMRVSPKTQSAVNTSLAPTMTPRGVGRASSSLAVRSENSRPKTQAMMKANRMAPP